MKTNGFTLIELLVVIVIIIVISVISIPTFQKMVSGAKCGAYKDQHKKVVDLANTTYTMCRLNGETYMNLLPGLTCRGDSRFGMTKISGDGYTTKCVRKWDCKSDHAGRTQNAGLSSGWFASHAKAEFNTPSNTSGFIREDQWQNFLKPNYPSRIGITNIRDKGKDMHIATYLGPDCKDGDFTNSGGSYMVDEIVWP